MKSFKSKNMSAKLSVICLISTLIVMASGCFSNKVAKDKKNSRPFFFVQLSDTQFGFFNNNKDFIKETQNFTKAIEIVNNLKPAFVIVTGDLINRAGDTIQINEYKRIASLLDPSIPLYNLPGNHDLTNKPDIDNIHTYVSHFGRDYYSFEYPDFLGIVLNSTIIVEQEKIKNRTNEQFKWLESTLKRAQNKGYKNIFVFQHHPWFIKNKDEEDNYQNIPTAIRKKYLDIFNKYNVHYIFAGHLHKNCTAIDNGIEMVTSSAVGRPLGQDPSGLRIVSVNKYGRVKHEYFALDSVPDKINF